MNEEGTWQTLLRRKYLGNKPLTQVTKQPGDSQFWSGLMEIKDQFFKAASLWSKMDCRQGFGRIGG